MATAVMSLQCQKLEMSNWLRELAVWRRRGKILSSSLSNGSSISDVSRTVLYVQRTKGRIVSGNASREAVEYDIGTEPTWRETIHAGNGRNGTLLFEFLSNAGRPTAFDSARDTISPIRGGKLDSSSSPARED